MSWTRKDIPNDMLGSTCGISLDFVWIDNPASQCDKCSAIFRHDFLKRWLDDRVSQQQNLVCPTCFAQWTNFVIYN
jgi:hypothetical protein